MRFVSRSKYSPVRPLHALPHCLISFLLRYFTEVAEIWPFAAGFTATVSAGLVLNPILAWLVLRKEMALNPKFFQWSQNHRCCLACVWLLAFPNPGELELLCSRLFGSELLAAPVSATFEQNIFTASLVTLLLREATQIALLLTMTFQWGAVGSEELVPLAVSGTVILLLLARKLWKIRSIQEKKAKDKRVQMELTSDVLNF